MASILVWALAVLAAQSDSDPTRPSVLVVVGAEGTPEYGEVFHKAAEAWKLACENGGTSCHMIGKAPEQSPGGDLDVLSELIAKQDQKSVDPLWIVLIGHGTFDGKHARFNLRGPDLLPEQLAQWLAEFQRPVILVNGASCSAPFLSALSGENRIVVTATKSGHEQNYARFNAMIAATLADQTFDLDKDGQVSLLESFLAASRKVEDYYAERGRLATEHALLDDNGDGMGTPADWFQGVHAVKRAKQDSALDGRRAHQVYLVPSPLERRISVELRTRRNELELRFFSLRDKKMSMDEGDYFSQLETLLVQLALVCEEIDNSTRR